ncbi:TIGR02594 family protein [Prosthecomicrobium pneumaticum]|uniref:Uncharacterized protein (TIGR02594 family) n=1 Tax=Prosthecomicrobium pneumaticum TaxID=81895 RepID=A0A7W9CVL1_9HYPH|nr:TIGR02594 family protein [Prosthecomicrobium pneumaticum]MBB5752177.1 uncharacterized protein (TIGR02594 family) [Prosthecomicrobium pneumaticum]
MVDRQDQADGWSSVRIDGGGGNGPKGFVRTEYLLEKTLAPQDVKLTDFVSFVAQAAVAANVDVAYLLALARIESGSAWDRTAGVIRASIYKDTGATGPFQFLASTWNDLSKTAGDPPYLRAVDIIDARAQAFMAAQLADDAINRHQKNFGGLPSPAELYLYHFFGWPAALKVMGGKGDQAIDSLLATIYDKPDRVTSIMNGNASLLKADGKPRTRDGVLDEVARRLFDAYTANAPLLAKPEDWWPAAAGSPASSGGPTPWLSIAEKEVGQSEVPGAASNPRISAYLTTVGFAANQSDETAWCAAFVCWCLENSGDATAIATAKKYRSSFAADWLKLPKVVLEPTAGAIGVTKPYSTDTTGHVGFVKSTKDGQVVLLAGNQKPAGGTGPDQVCEKVFPRSDFVGFRWIGT